MTIVLDKAAGVAIRGCRAARFSAIDTLIVDRLLTATRPVSRKELFEAAYAHRKDGGPLAYSNISARLNKIQERMRRLGVELIRQGRSQTRRYRFVELEESDAQ